MSDDIEKQLADIEAMFVHVARDFTRDGDRVTFHGLSPATLFFADRPQRVVGHLSAQQFVEEWGKGEDSFAEDPPNGVISFLGAGDETPEDAIVMLMDPDLDGDELTYTIQVLEGALPEKAEACSVFIDPFGRPLTPVSVAGVRRRERRRMARRF